MTTSRYTTSDRITATIVDAPAKLKRAGIKHITWAKFGDGWAMIGGSKASDMAGALKSAKSTAPYAKDWDATPATDTQA